MSARVIPVSPFTITVIGASGDLARRKLYPALWQRVAAGQAPAQSALIGAARQDFSDEEFRAVVRESLVQAGAIDGGDGGGEGLLDEWLGSVRYFKLDATAGDDDDGWRRYAAALRALPRPQLFYFAVAPSLAGALCARLRSSGALVEASDDDGGGSDGDGGGASRLILEKPFGSDYASARDLNAVIKTIAAERDIYRIDHYLGKETVQNLMALRFANALLEPLWNARAIDHVQITVAEELGAGGRGEYYDASGAARDMLQNHLLQMLCLTAMEAPAKYQADAVRDEKLKVLRALRAMDADALRRHVVCGQYVSGGGGQSYLDDIGKRESRTETFIALKCFIDNWRWAQVPFYLRTGKRLTARMSEIVVCFKQAPHSIFPQISALPFNSLVIRLQPAEGITLTMNIKAPGPGGFRLATVPLDMSFAAALGIALPDAYQRLLMDVVRGDQTLFMRSDELEAAWQWVDPITRHIAARAPEKYACGSSGPDDALRLMHADGRKWNDIA